MNVNVAVCLRGDLSVDFVTAILTREIGAHELISTITLVLQTNRLTKCAKVEIKILAM